MIMFFDYIFYRCYQYYESKGLGNNGIPVFWSTSIVSICQTLNIDGLWMGFNLIQTGEVGISKYTSLFIAVTLIVFNFIRYNFIVTYSSLKSKWELETIEIRKARGKNIILYLLFSLLGMLGILLLLKAFTS